MLTAAKMSSRSSEDNFDNAGHQYVALYQSMYDLNEKLLSLDYSKEFVSTFKCPPVNRYFFSKKTNPAQQFFTFCCLSSFVVNKLSDRDVLKVDSFDDPNVTIDKILNSAQNYIDIAPFASVKHSFKQGYGVEIINFLTLLVDQYWIRKSDSLHSDNVTIAFISTDGVRVEASEEDEDNDVDEDIEEDNEIELEEEFGDYIIDGNNIDEPWDDSWTEQLDKKMIVANTDVSEWKLELERILPQLNARFIGQNMHRSGAYDNEWRLHHEAAVSHYSNIGNVFHRTESMVRNLTTDLRVSLDKIQSKEKYLHQNLNTILAEWSNVRERALKLRQTFDKLNSDVKEKSEQLQELTEEDKSTKQSIEEYSLSMTDSSPLVEAKKAREMLKNDLVKVNLQIGVAVQTLVKHVSLHTPSYLY